MHDYMQIKFCMPWAILIEISITKQNRNCHLSVCIIIIYMAKAGRYGLQACRIFLVHENHYTSGKYPHTSKE